MLANIADKRASIGLQSYHSQSGYQPQTSKALTLSQVAFDPHACAPKKVP